MQFKIIKSRTFWLAVVLSISVLFGCCRVHTGLKSRHQKLISAGYNLFSATKVQHTTLFPIIYLPPPLSPYHRESGLLTDVITTFDHMTNKTSQSTLFWLRQLCLKTYCMFSVTDKLISHANSMTSKKHLIFRGEKIKKKQHKEDLFTTQFLHLWYKICHLLAVQRLRKTQETVNSFTKTIAFCTFKNPSVFFCFLSKSEMFLFLNFLFLFCSETSKAGKAKTF